VAHRDPSFDRDACGVGFLAELGGRPTTRVLPLALTALARLGHRGAVGADGKTGDGAGVMTGIPWQVLQPSLEHLGLGALATRDLAVGLLFLPRDARAAQGARATAEAAIRAEGLVPRGFRRVPTRDEVLGDRARASRPGIEQLVVERGSGGRGEDFERRLYRARRAMELAAGGVLHVASLSQHTLVYKAMVQAADLEPFYLDLQHPAFATAFALFHQRFSTNTEPSWPLAQPFRFLAHNGEINTIDGNRCWMRAREPSLASPRLGYAPGGLRPALSEGGSDSASLDDAVGLIRRAGRGLLHAVSLLLPPAWEGDPELPEEVRAFFEYQSSLMEPWDGPALAVFADGRVVGAALDRNGLRPARYAVTADGLVIVASEAGVLDVEDGLVSRRGRLGPGDMLAVDLETGRLHDALAVRRRLAARRPYQRWLRENRRRLADLPPAQGLPAEPAAPELRVLRAFGYTREEMQFVLGPMYREAREPLGSMGDDTPLAVLSPHPRLLFSYFKQRFAQVTNPPIDPLREQSVMSLVSHLGPKLNLLSEEARAAAQLHLESPILGAAALAQLRSWDDKATTLSLLYDSSGGLPAFHDALDALLLEAGRAVESGARILVLSDRGVDGEHAALPSLLAVSAVHGQLLRRGLRLRASLVVETGEARDDHHLACLLGYGASAIHPYLAFQAVHAAAREAGASAVEAEQRYQAALEKGLLKILSKMGISTLRSYQGAQLFEAIGVSGELIARHFAGTPAVVEGVGLDEIASDVQQRHAHAFAPTCVSLEEGSLHRFRRGGEAHAYEPAVIKALHAAVRTGERLPYRVYADLVHQRDPIVLRDLLEFRQQAPVSLDHVEPAEALLPRFMTAAMSLGALSPEAQQVLAIAMNRIGGRSNSGEGGEPPENFRTLLPGGDRANNAIKQVASARFGVTTSYLVAADELQIKMAQGSKPGEGGQLPGHKVAPHIARLRHSPVGVTLISPPPHHDIYSIEDLAQLIYDLKRVNPEAAVSVKLVAQAGVGTVAAGVAKAHADAIVIDGHDGGTGASPLGSIKNAGTPWELGLADVQRALVRGGLRGRVRLQVEGGLKTGRDVVIAALLGADEFGFGTAALVAAGCRMARQCHLNTCPVGIATQREDLRQRFEGTPEQVVAFFRAVAEEVREILAQLGLRRLQEAVGRADLLEARTPRAGTRAARVSVSPLIGLQDAAAPLSADWKRNLPPATGAGIDESVLGRLRFRAAGVLPLDLEFAIGNADRAVGARVAGELARRLPGPTLAPGSVRLRFRGVAGQSFGAFCVEGMQLRLEGEANDFVGKGMCGGELALLPARTCSEPSPVIAGNTLLYGATGGRVFVAGRVGERFAVRNSGALAVVEGVGDHACEYMTGGAVVILGSFGRNLGAGMSGGLVYLFDPGRLLPRRLNPEMVAVAASLSAVDTAWIHEALKRHLAATGSRLALRLLDSWNDTLGRFQRLAPRGAESSRPQAWPVADLELALGPASHANEGQSRTSPAPA